MRRTPADMVFAVALAVSALLHVAVLIGPGWTLPGLDEPEADAAARLDAVLTPAAPAKAITTAKATTATPPAMPARRPAPPAAPPAQPAAPVPASVPAAGAANEPAPATAAAGAVPPAPTLAAPAPAVAAPESPPAPSPAPIALATKGRARYVVTKGEDGFVIGQTVQEWTHDGARYAVRLVTETTGLAALFKPARVVQESRGEIVAGGLRPLSFRHERVGAVDTAAFDWTAGTLAYEGKVEPLPAGTQDMLSMYYQLMLFPPRAGGSIELPIATGRKLERFRIESLGEERLALPGGPRRALHLRTRSGNDSIDVWIAPDSHDPPLKIRFTDRKGDVFDQVIDDAAPNVAPTAAPRAEPRTTP